MVTSRGGPFPGKSLNTPLKFNFVGKLLGPRGNSMKRLQEETGAKMSILGKGSMRDKGKRNNPTSSNKQRATRLQHTTTKHAVRDFFVWEPARGRTPPALPKSIDPEEPAETGKSAGERALIVGSKGLEPMLQDEEEELRQSGEAKYGHLSNDLHVLMEVFAPPGEAYTRMSSALDEIKKFLVPDYNDEIRQEQLRELSYLNGSDETGRGRTAPARALRPAFAPASRGRGGIGRGSVASRGALVTQSNPASAAGTRDTPSHRGRGAPANPGYRPALLPITHEPYEDYSYDDGYDGQYDDESYDAHDDSYSNQSKSISEFYEYGHGASDDAYNNYEEDWAACRPKRKAPTARLSRGGFREHPYGRY
ncbi:unnamed protein product [Arctogadus glacialis]